MADRTGIEWTDATWNPVVGCSIVSPGCTNCYAMAMAGRIERMEDGKTHYAGTTKATKAAPSELLAEAGLVRIDDAADRLIATAKARNDRGEWVGGSLWTNIRDEIARDMRP